MPANAVEAEKHLAQIRDAGVTFFRESGGNNSTKYNWRRRLSSHPDWYNNVYVNNWDQAALALQKDFPSAQGMWAFQLAGMAAKTSQFNFNDWGYNQSKWWEGVNQNLAGNGIPNATGTKALKEGDINLYLEKWNADSTVGILKHWFGTEGIGLKKEKIRYWNMDNEPEIWVGTHDDVMPVQLSPEEFMQRYFEVAKKARAAYPDIKLVGPVTANEWQWYNWGTKPVLSGGKYYPWLEFFIKRVGEEQRASGTRLLDVLDIHFYPGTKKPEEVVQLHRVFFDRTYDFPEANGVKNSSGIYDNSSTKEYIFGRISDWLVTYLGDDHGVGLGVTETGIDQSISSDVTSVWYASTLGEFMKNGVELFAPWYWKPGMWETLHLFTRLSLPYALNASSSNEAEISAYPTVSSTRDSVTLVVVNRSRTTTHPVSIRLDHFIPHAEAVQVFTLSQLPDIETFVSKDVNALKRSMAVRSGDLFNLSLPPMSVTAVQVRGQPGDVVLGNDEHTSPVVTIYPNPTRDTLFLKWEKGVFREVEVIDETGKVMVRKAVEQSLRSISIPHHLSSGIYLVRLTGAHQTVTKKLIIK